MLPLRSPPLLKAENTPELIHEYFLSFPASTARGKGGVTHLVVVDVLESKFGEAGRE